MIDWWTNIFYRCCNHQPVDVSNDCGLEEVAGGVSSLVFFQGKPAHHWSDIYGIVQQQMAALVCGLRAQCHCHDIRITVLATSPILPCQIRVLHIENYQFLFYTACLFASLCYQYTCSSVQVGKHLFVSCAQMFNNPIKNTLFLPMLKVESSQKLYFADFGSKKSEFSFCPG